MHVSNIFSDTGFAALQSTRQSEGAGGADFLEEMQQAAGDPIAEVMRNYDLQNITPFDIDQLVDELRGAGHPFDQDLLMLSSRGAAFRSHLSEMVGGQYDAHQKINLITQTQNQIEMSRRFGDPTEALEDFLAFLNAADQRQVLDAEKLQQRLIHESMVRQALGAGETSIR